MLFVSRNNRGPKIPRNINTGQYSNNSISGVFQVPVARLVQDLDKGIY
jgi:hypothetical protein